MHMELLRTILFVRLLFFFYNDYNNKNYIILSYMLFSNCEKIIYEISLEIVQKEYFIACHYKLNYIFLNLHS